MAKAKETASAQEQLPVVVPAPAELVQVAVSLDKDDVAAIMTARAEEYLKKAINECKKRDKAIEKEVAALEKTKTKQLDDAAAAFFADASTTLKEAAATLKAKSVEVVTSAHGYTEKNGRGRGGTIECSMCVTGDKPAISWRVSQRAPMPAEVRETLAAIKAKAAEQKANNEEWMTFRRKLADLPSLERRTKALVAAQRLEQSTDGAQLLEMLKSDENLEQSVALLGVN